MYVVIKRFLDLLFASILLVLAVPIGLLIAAGLLLEGHGPVFFTQTRAGRHGAPFRILKFRTMIPGVHDITNPLAHTTRYGRFLRRWGLDELPQLVNVLAGQMSLIGPRPTLPEQVARYDEEQRRRLDVPPGITGWAQVHGRNALPWAQRIELDIAYINHLSFALDVRIAFRTVGILINGTGLYGSDNKNPDFA